MQQLWTEDHNNLLDELKKEILSHVTLARPDFNVPFILKTDWSSHARGAVLCQPDPDHPDTPRLIMALKETLVCPFDLTKSGPQLQPILFISRMNTKPEQSQHSYIGEAITGWWAMNKLKKYLLGNTFIWLTDCSGLKRFFETSDDPPHHLIQRKRAELLQFDYIMNHRPARMMCECDMMSRYNGITAGWQAIATEGINNKTGHDETVQTMTSVHVLTAPTWKGSANWKYLHKQQ